MSTQKQDLRTAAQANAAGCTRSHPHENMDSSCHAKSAIAEMQSMAVRGAEATAQDLERFVSMLAAAPTTQPACQQEAGPSDPSITLDFKMASELLDMFGGEPGLVTLQHGGEKCHSGAGLYAWHSDLPEEGAAFLGAEPHDEAAPTTQPAPQQEPILYDQKALLEVFQNAQAGSSGTAGTLRGIAAVIASWESRTEPHTWLIAAPQPSPAAQGGVDNWIDPNDKTQAKFLPHIGEPVLFCHGGKTYFGKHSGGSFVIGVGLLTQHFNTWACHWQYLPEARAAQEGKSHE